MSGGEEAERFFWVLRPKIHRAEVEVILRRRGARFYKKTKTTKKQSGVCNDGTFRFFNEQRQQTEFEET